MGGPAGYEDASNISRAFGLQTAFPLFSERDDHAVTRLSIAKIHQNHPS
jgi:hypothetical protein